VKIFSATQIKQWDAFTIANEPIAAIDLMERAATACYHWLIGHNYAQKQMLVFCGKGNNGGDGLAVARMLIKNNCSVTVYILEFGNIGTTDFQTNLTRLHECSTNIHFIQSPDFFPLIPADSIIIDALFGTGLNKPLDGISAALVNHINASANNIVAIDLPSGMFAYTSSKDNAVVKATHTLTFQNYKLAFLLAENENCNGEIHLIHIGLHQQYEADEESIFELTDKAIIKSIYRPRKKFTHKGTYGHAALISGSYGMMGAAVLAAKACLKTGAGKLTCFIPECGCNILQTTVPEAMCKVSGEKFILSVNEIEKFDALGIGPGIGLYTTHTSLLKEVFTASAKPILIDADALNMIAENKELLPLIPPASIITPHPKEFERLFGKTANDFDRLQLALQKSKEYNIYIILKGHFTFISTPEGKGYFNCTGNAGMATAGSGDVLSGFITGLLAQAYSPLQASLLGVYLHGLAGDIAADQLSQEALVAEDITACIGASFKTLV
jgi:ADP-dependent NAD(P)H-hydrate dehydratase / NAD(P)H-hydrate epimerase